LPDESEPDDLDPFWIDVAARFKDNPNICFAPGAARFVTAIRQAGARQPVIVAGLENTLQEDRDIIHEVRPRYAAIDTNMGECGLFPGDPAEATELVVANLVFRCKADFVDAVVLYRRKADHGLSLFQRHKTGYWPDLRGTRQIACGKSGWSFCRTCGTRGRLACLR
jgi:hypothetical protein